MGDAQDLDQLVKTYIERAEQTKNDSDYIKAHGLANACAFRHPEVERFEQVYEIEKNWYNGDHPCESMKNAQILIDQHKKTLADARTETRDRLKKLEPETNFETLRNLLQGRTTAMDSFSEKVFLVCHRLNEDIVRLLQNMLELSLGFIGEQPSSFALIQHSLHSETASYSGMHFGFLLENENHLEYFRRLSVDFQFRIMNLGETSTDVLGVEELARESQLKVTDVHGLHVSQFSINTMKELLDQERDSPIVTLLYPKGGKGAQIFHRYRKQMDEELRSENNASEFCNHLYTKLKDLITAYKFLPEFVLHPCAPEISLSTIRTDQLKYLIQIFGCFTQLLEVRTTYPWETLQELGFLNLIAEQDFWCFNTALAFSLYVLTNSAVSHNGQKEYQLTTPTTDGTYLPHTVFMSVGYLLMSIHRSLSHNITQNQNWKPPSTTSSLSDQFVEAFSPLLRQHDVKNDWDFMLEVELLLFANDRESALKVLYSASGEEPLESCQKFVTTLSDVYGIADTSSRMENYVEICFKVLFLFNKYPTAVKYLAWLVNKDNEKWLERWKDFVIQCYRRSVHYNGAKMIIDTLLQIIEAEFGLKEGQSLVGYIKEHKSSKESMALLVCSLYIWCGRHCRQLNEIKVAIVCFEAVSSLCETFNIRNSVGVSIPYELAETYYSMGQYDKALNLYTELLETKELNLNDTDKSRVFKRIALTHGRMGKYQKSLKFLTEINDMDKDSFGEYSTEVACGYTLMAVIYGYMLDYSKSLKYHTKALDFYISAHGRNVNHADIALCNRHIANVHRFMCNYSMSLEHHTKSLHMYKELFGKDEDHAQISTTYNHIGAVHESIEEFKLSLEYYNKSLAMTKRLYGESNDHSETAECYNDLGDVYTSLGAYTQAKEYYSMSLDITTRLYGDDVNHPSIASSYGNIAHFYLMCEEYANSMLWYSKSLSMWKVLRGDVNHLTIAASYGKIATLCCLMGDYSQSLEYHRKSLQMSKVLHGANSNHPEIATSYNNLGCMYFLMVQYPTSLFYHRKALEMRSTFYGPDTDHPSIANSYTHIGRLYSMTGIHTAAIEYIDKAIQMWKKVYGQESSQRIAFGYRCLGEAYTMMGDYKRDELYHQKSLSMLNRMCKETHTDIARAYSKLGQMYSVHSNHPLSQESHEKSLCLRKNLHGEDTDHPDIADNYHDLGDMCMMKGDALRDTAESFTRTDRSLDTAESYSKDYKSKEASESYTMAEVNYNKALEMRKALFGEHAAHPDLAKSYNQLYSLYYKMGQMEKMSFCSNMTDEIGEAVEKEFVNIEPL